MDYASSFAVGGPQLGHHPGMPQQYAGGADVVLPAPKPQRMHWSTLLFVTGMSICAVVLLATIAGVPGNLGYDVDGAAWRNKPSSNPIDLTKSLDGNMKWLAENSADQPNGYVGYVKSVNRSEVAIPLMVQAVAAMDASLTQIDGGLAEVGKTTVEMRKHMEHMAEVSKASADTMSGLGDDIGFLSGSMVELASATEQLTQRMAAIEKQAGNIAANGTSSALKNTKDLNSSLPSEVPMPLADDGRPLDQAMAELARGGGGTTLDAYEQGGVQ